MLHPSNHPHTLPILASALASSIATSAGSRPQPVVTVKCPVSSTNLTPVVSLAVDVENADENDNNDTSDIDEEVSHEPNHTQTSLETVYPYVGLSTDQLTMHDQLFQTIKQVCL